MDPANWEIITDDMANVTQSPIGTAYAARLQNIDFAGKTGTAQVVNHSFGALKLSSDISQRANAWFVGVAPRRNPDIVVVVFWQHGGWGAGSASIAGKVIQAFVDKQRRLDHNLIAPQVQPQPVDVGALWSDPGSPNAMGGRALETKQRKDITMATVRAGHFYIRAPQAQTPSSALAAAVR
jgi:penicillin-binding protein 2